MRSPPAEPKPLECERRSAARLLGAAEGRSAPGRHAARGQLAVDTSMGASFCATADMVGLPPPCTTQEECTAAGLTSAMCRPLGPLGSYCLQLCQ